MTGDPLGIIDSLFNISFFKKSWDYLLSKFYRHIVKKKKSNSSAGLVTKKTAIKNVILNLPSAPFPTSQRQLLLTILAGSVITYLRISR